MIDSTKPRVVTITIDGIQHSVTPGAYTFEELTGATKTHPETKTLHLVFRPGDTYEVKGGEHFKSSKQEYRA